MYKGLSFDFDAANKSIISKLVKKSKPAYSEFTLFRTYSRMIIEENRKETIDEIYLRVVRGVFSLIKDHLLHKSVVISDGTRTNLWQLNEKNMQKKALRLMQILYEDKMTPPGRGLWAMGTELVNKERVAMALVNCTFITSKNIAIIYEEFFTYVMDTLMLGAGVGFDDLGNNLIDVFMPTFSPYRYSLSLLISKNDKYGYYLVDQLQTFIVETRKNNFTDSEGVMYLQREYDYMQSVIMQTLLPDKCVTTHVIKDSREGWVNALRTLLRSYFHKGEYIVLFDYSKIRPQGLPLKKFGGVSSGPAPLVELLSAIRFLLQNKYIGKKVDSLLIIDICNIIARTVIAGNVRRSSQICLSTNPDIVNAKRYDNPNYKYREKWGWASNNSYVASTENNNATIIAEPLDEKKEQLSKETIAAILKNNYYNGEPGLFMLDNARKSGRIIDGINFSDMRVDGTNPCGEISLEGTTDSAQNVPGSSGGETCNLFETFPCNYDDNNEFYDDLELAVLYSKAVTLLSYHWKCTDEIQKKNRRIGISMSGIALHLAKTNYDLDLFAKFCDTAYKRVCKYDAEISKLFGIPESIKKTTIKPSGSVSTGANVTSGMHFPINSTYIRRIRLSSQDETSKIVLSNANIPLEDDSYSSNTLVSSFPVKLPYKCKSMQEITVDFQFELHRILQTYWADNQVSCTITFKEEEFQRLHELVYDYQHVIKGISFLKLNTTIYKQAPLESITEEEYERLNANILPLNLTNINSCEDIESDMYCDGDSCVFVHKQK